MSKEIPEIISKQFLERILVRISENSFDWIPGEILETYGKESKTEFLKNLQKHSCRDHWKHNRMYTYKKTWKNLGEISGIFFKKILQGCFVEFSRGFIEWFL